MVSVIFGRVKNILKFNDSFLALYFVLMILLYSSPNLLFSSNFSLYKSFIGGYMILVMFALPKIRRIDISQNLFKWGVLGLFFALIMSSIIPQSIDSFNFLNKFTSFIWFFIVVGVSETLIMLGVLDLIKNIYYSSFIMGSMHVYVISQILGNFSLLNPQMWTMVLMSSLGFFGFYMIWKKSKDLVLVALLHAFLDFFMIK